MNIVKFLRTVFKFFRNYSANISQHLSNEEYEVLKNLSANCNLIKQKADLFVIQLHINKTNLVRKFL